MYHISNDKRAIQSSELIYQGLLDCMKKKSFDRITISDLQKTSGIARTTFYRAFDNISDVLYWKCDTCFYEVLGNYHPQPFQEDFNLIRHYFEYWMEHSDILELLMQINRQDIIYSCHMKKCPNPATAVRRTSRKQYKTQKLFYCHPHRLYYQYTDHLAKWRQTGKCRGISTDY